SNALDAIYEMLIGLETFQKGDDIPKNPREEVFKEWMGTEFVQRQRAFFVDYARTMKDALSRMVEKRQITAEEYQNVLNIIDENMAKVLGEPALRPGDLNATNKLVEKGTDSRVPDFTQKFIVPIRLGFSWEFPFLTLKSYDLLTPRVTIDGRSFLLS